MVSQDFLTTPIDLPKPVDDGACSHLQGCRAPSVKLNSTLGPFINLQQTQGLTVLFCYPMTGKPGVALPVGWDSIPGARGCTPQACSYKHNHSALTKTGAAVFGLSTQSTEYQLEAAQRLKLPYALLSDKQLLLATALKLPTFEVGGVGELIKRLTLIIKDGVVVHSIYPIFPSDSDVPQVLQWLKEHP